MNQCVICMQLFEEYDFLVDGDFCLECWEVFDSE